MLARWAQFCKDCYIISTSTPSCPQEHDIPRGGGGGGGGGGGVLPMWWVIHMCRGFDPLFSLWQDRARSFWGIFSHPPTPKQSFGVLKLPILKEFDLLGPKFHFSLDLFGSNFQRPAAHPHQFSDQVHDPPPGMTSKFVTTTVPSCIDNSWRSNIFTNCFSNIHDTFQCLIQTDISDHFPIIHVDGSVKQANIDTYILRRNMSQRNKHDFLCAMSNVDWSSIYSDMCTQGAFSLFHSTLVNHYNKHFPMQKIKLKYNCRKPWLTQGLKDAIKVKNKLYKKYQKINAVAHEIEYKTYRNKLNHILKCAERKHYSDLLNDNKNNVKRTRQILKSIVNKNKTTKIQDKFKLSDGTFISDKSMISTKFNEFFIGIGPNLARNIQKQSVTPFSFMGQSWVNSIYLHEVTSEEVINILQSLKNGAAGYDWINASTLKLVSSLIVNPLRYICNLSLIEGVFPTELKIANVLPCINQMTRFVLIITDQYLCYVFYQRFLKRLCIIVYLTFLRNTSSLLMNNLDLENLIHPTWHLWPWWISLLNPLTKEST